VQEMEPGNVTKVLFSVLNDYFGISPEKIVSVLGGDLQHWLEDAWRIIKEMADKKKQNQGAAGPPAAGPPQQGAGQTAPAAAPQGFGWPSLFGKPIYQYIPYYWLTGKVPWGENK